MKINGMIMMAALALPCLAAAQDVSQDRKELHQDERQSERIRREIREVDRKQNEALSGLNRQRQGEIGKLDQEYNPKREQLLAPFRQQQRSLQDQMAKLRAQENDALKGLNAERRTKMDQINKDYKTKEQPIVQPFDQKRQALRQQLGAAEADERKERHEIRKAKSSNPKPSTSTSPSK